MDRVRSTVSAQDPFARLSRPTQELARVLESGVDTMLRSDAPRLSLRRLVACGVEMTVGFSTPGMLDALSRRYAFLSCEHGSPPDIAVEWSPGDPNRMLISDISGHTTLFDASRTDSVHFASMENCELVFAGSWSGLRSASLDEDTADPLPMLLVAAADQTLAFALMRRLGGWLFVHAAVVESSLHSIALLGSSGAGKSTLCRHLIDRGMRIVADDLIAFSHAGDRLAGLPRWSAGHVGPRTGFNHTAFPTVTVTGQTRHLILLEPACRRASVLRPIDPVVALQRISTGSLVVPPGGPAPDIDAIGHFVGASRCWALSPKRGDPDGTARSIIEQLEGDR